jgi:hypothetical protein
MLYTLSGADELQISQCTGAGDNPWRSPARSFSRGASRQKQTRQGVKVCGVP